MSRRMPLAQLMAFGADPTGPKSDAFGRGTGRAYGGGSKKYVGPRDVDHRKGRIRLTTERLRSLNIAYRKETTRP